MKSELDLKDEKEKKEWKKLKKEEKPVERGVKSWIKELKRGDIAKKVIISK